MAHVFSRGQAHAGRTMPPPSVPPVSLVVPVSTVTRPGSRVWRWFRRLVAAGTGLILCLAAGIWAGHRQGVTLPPLTGPYAVGRANESWTVAASEPFADRPDTPRRMVAWIWYPAVPTAATSPSPYVPTSWRDAILVRRSVLIDTLFWRDLDRIHARALDAPAVADTGPYPVVLLRAGLGAFTTDYSALAEDLASHGYVVVGIDVPYRTFLVVLPDGSVVVRPAAANPETLSSEAARALGTRLMKAWTEDTSTLVDRLSVANADSHGRFFGRLDLTAIAAVGHSLGGATSMEFCRTDPRCRAAVDIDGLPLGDIVSSGTATPTMFLLSDHSGESDPESRRIEADIETIYARLPPDRRFRADVAGANHFSFSDQLLARNPVLMAILRTTGVIPLAPGRGLRLTGDAVRRFIDVYLKHAPREPLDHLAADYPEITVRDGTS
jgi:predicted dienelactone hydrolase